MNLLDFLLYSKKAVVAFALSGAAWLLAKIGADVDISVREAVETGVAAVVGFVGVWFSNNKKVK